MTLKELDKLVKNKTLKVEATDQLEFDRMLESAKRSLKDARVEGLSEVGKFSCAYTAAYLLSFAALRRCGYRSNNRYQVFQCLIHTVEFDEVKCRILCKCHDLRNAAEYEGHLEITPHLLDELIKITEELLIVVEKIGPIT